MAEQSLLTPQPHQSRDKLREQNALSEEIVNAITNNSLGEPIDEDELEEELEALEQEKLDEQMLNTGTVRATESIHRLPPVVNGERKLATSIRGLTSVPSTLYTKQSWRNC